jgi:cytochrome c
MKPIMIAAVIALVVAPTAARAEGGDAERGRQVYESKCIACHSLDVNRVGPRHRDVFGRQAGFVDDYRYSKALKEQGSNGPPWLSTPG